MSIAAQLQRLAGLRMPPDDASGYEEALAGVPLDLLERAVSHLLRSEEFFPAPATVLAACDRVGGSRGIVTDDPARETPIEPFTIAVPGVGAIARVTREWRYYCDRCSDIGWASYWCGDGGTRAPWVPAGACGRGQDHGGHEWVGQCTCWFTNPALVKRRDAARVFAAEPVTARRMGR